MLVAAHLCRRLRRRLRMSMARPAAGDDISRRRETAALPFTASDKCVKVANRHHSGGRHQLWAKRDEGEKSCRQAVVAGDNRRKC